MSETYTPPPPPPPGGGSYTPPPPPPPPPPAGGGTAPGSDRTIMLVLSYLGLLALIPMLTKKEDSEIQWHSKNGLVLGIAWFVVWVAWEILSVIMVRIIGPFACLGWLAGKGERDGRGVNVGGVLEVLFFPELFEVLRVVTGQGG